MIQLENMRPGEKVEMIIKRHWIIFVMLGLYTIIGISVTITIFKIFGNQMWIYLFSIIFWMLFLIFLYIEWLNHELDMFIVTNNRIIGLEQLSFLNRTISECNLGQVQEVNATTKGLLANLLDYGDVVIQTAGNISNFEMSYVPNAIQTSRKILNEVDSYRDSHSLNNNLKEKDNV